MNRTHSNTSAHVQGKRKQLPVKKARQTARRPASRNAGETKSYLGIEIGGTKLQIVLGDNAGIIHQRRRFNVDRHQGSAGIRDQIQEALPELFALARPSAIAVGFGGPVDWRTGRIIRSHQIEGWSGFDLAGWLSSLAPIPVRLDNDANMAALGEATLGAGRGRNPVFYMTLGSGVGGGLVVDKSIYHGAEPGESEIGHLRLDRQGSTVESRCSGWAIDERIRRFKASGAQSLLCQLVGDAVGGESRHLARALKENDPVAGGMIAEIGQDLGFALSHVVHLFHPQVIVIGGGLSLIGEPLRAAVAEALLFHVMEAFAPGPEVKLAALGEDAVPVGCLLAARNLAAMQQPA